MATKTKTVKTILGTKFKELTVEIECVTKRRGHLAPG